MDNPQSNNETNRKTAEQTINENIEDCKCYRQADVLDQTRLRALGTSVNPITDKNLTTQTQTLADGQKPKMKWKRRKTDL